MATFDIKDLCTNTARRKTMKDKYFETIAIVAAVASIFLCFFGQIPHATFTMVVALMGLYLQDRKW